MTLIGNPGLFIILIVFYEVQTLVEHLRQGIELMTLSETRRMMTMICRTLLCVFPLFLIVSKHYTVSEKGCSSEGSSIIFPVFLYYTTFATEFFMGQNIQ